MKTYKTSETSKAKVKILFNQIANLTDAELYVLTSLMCDDWGNQTSSTYRAIKFLASNSIDSLESLDTSVRFAAKHT